MKMKPAPTPAGKKPSARVGRPQRGSESPSRGKNVSAAQEAVPPPKRRRSSIKKIKETFAAAIEAVAAPLKIKRPARPKTSEVAPASPVRRTYTRHKEVEVPPILMESEAAAPPHAGGPGEKFALGPSPVAQKFEAGESDLPEAYGTKKLFLTARDPHWLYLSWDLTREQLLKLNARSVDGHLVLRIFTGKIEGHPTHEIHVHPESRHWFAHVEHAGNSYAAELGYYSPVGRWTRVAASAATVTPPDAVAAEENVEFATIPFEFPFAKLIEIIKAAVCENLPLAQAVEELRRGGHPELPRINGTPVSTWTPQQEQALAKVIAIDDVRRVWMGSLEITELIRRRLAREISSLGVSQFGVSSVSSPFGGFGQAKGFWFNVNAELIIYGATEPTAKVTLGGHEIKLRPDGSFSFRFALPDGKYDLPAVAVSADGTEARAAKLKFSRETEYIGDVGAHPQDPALQPPAPENL
jgi:uncharacterized protein